MPETVTLNGLETRFELHGEGTSVVYTPGAFYSLESSRIVAEALVPLGYQVLLWDRPNTGESGLVFEPDHPLRQWADKLDALFDHIGFSSAYAAGVTYGLQASLHFATWYPSRVRGLVLVAALTGDQQWWQALVDATFLEPARAIEEQGMAAALELWEGRRGPLDARRLHDALPDSELVISAEYLGDPWGSVLEQVKKEDNFDPLGAALGARIDEFIRSSGS